MVFEAVDGKLCKGPLKTVEMERAIGMPDGYTEMSGTTDRKRHHMTGNSFHVGVVEHVIRWWLLRMQEFDATIGYPGEGLDRLSADMRRRKRRRAHDGLDDGVDKRRRLKQLQVQPKVLQQRSGKSPAVARKGKQKGKQAAWKSVLPGEQQSIRGASLFDVWVFGGWDPSERLVLGHFATAKKVRVPRGAGFSDFVKKVQHDLILGARSDNTRKAYVAWVKVFTAWLQQYGLAAEASRGVQ